MTTPFIGEIQVFGFNFAPRDWALCNGAILPISQYTALFSLLGTNYGGNGQSNFQLPNFASRVACEQGQGPGLTQRDLGETFGVASVTLNINEIPQHNHVINAFVQSDQGKRVSTPVANGGLSQPSVAANKPFLNAAPSTQFAPNMIGASANGSQPHENQQPYLAVNFCIALNGAFPSFD